MSVLRDHAVAGAWGFAEATAFFVVPDVWLSAVALRNLPRGLACAASATAGALVGGAVVHRWGARVPGDDSARMLAGIPAVSSAMVARVERDMAARGFTAVLLGPLRGTPYKLYARTAGLRGDPLHRFLAWSVPARAPRFVVVTAAVGGISALHGRLWPDAPARVRWAIFGTGWTAFYAWYFRTVGRE
ncbi:hypothetical protein NUV30_05080 [Kocuria rhizophila]|uniref:hypothetical protein n=1 Tax=Kocuria rhizophila TaxID=72000 RepID=UPI00214FE209|nr:hypothetical protein [Kocuria rhizophila]MCR4525757.1 hypothetical protein [Kocuria rhizophila]